MNRLDAAFDGRRKALVCYLPLGDPAIDFDLASEYEAAGVDVFEIGVPNGEPFLDGQTVSDSLWRAASAGVTGRRAAELVRAMRNAFPDNALVWMTYSSTPGAKALLDAVVGSGVDGLLAVGERHGAGDAASVLRAAGIHRIPFLAFDPTLRDVEAVIEWGGGYVMLQAVPAPTGTRLRLLPESGAVITMMRRLGLEQPVAMGVGISTPAHAASAIEMGADGVIIGTAVVEAALRGRRRLRAFLRALRRAIDGG